MDFRIIPLEERIVLDALLGSVAEPFIVDPVGDVEQLLVISDAVDGAEQLVAGASENTRVLLYDADSDLASLATQIAEAADGLELDSIGFVNHGDSDGFELTERVRVSGDSLENDSSVQGFWDQIGLLVKDGGRVDLLACNFGEAGEDVLGRLDAILDEMGLGHDVSVGASTDLTGHSSLGGDWHLEVGDVAADEVYFAPGEAEQWLGVLAPPLAFMDLETTDEDTAIIVDVADGGFPSDDYDPDGDPIEIVSVTTPTGGGTATFTPGTTLTTFDPTGAFDFLQVGQSASTMYSYTITDNNGGFATSKVMVTVDGVNDDPIGGDDTTTTDEDSSVLISKTQLQNGALGGADTDPDTIDGTPAITGFSATSALGGTVTDAGTDFDYDPTGIAGVNNLAVGDTLLDTFTYEVTDPMGATANATVTVVITGNNDAPTANDDNFTTNEDSITVVSPTTGAGVDTDPDGDTLTISTIDDTGTLGSVTLLGDMLSVQYDPDGNFEFLAAGESVEDTFVYFISDGNGGVDQATVTILVTGVNDPPLPVADTMTALEDSGGTILISTVVGNDVDNDTSDGTPTFLASLSPSAAGAIISDDGTTITYTTNGAFENLPVGVTDTDTFNYTVVDAALATATGTISVTVTGQNDAPTANNDSATTTEDTTTNYNPLGNDTDPDDGEAATLTILGVQTGSTTGLASLNPDNVSIDYDPNGQFESLAVFETAIDTVAYVISDGNGGTDTGTVSFTITGVNDQPTAQNDSATTDEDNSVVIDPIGGTGPDSDPDTSDTLLVSNLNLTGTAGTASITGGGTTVTYDPLLAFQSLAVGESNQTSFQYTVSDGNGGFDTATVFVNVTGVNDAPVGVDDLASTDEDTATTFDVISNDNDIDTSDTLSILSFDALSTAGAVVSLASATELQYNPSGLFETLGVNGGIQSTTDTFTYTVQDGNGGSSVATVTMTITAVNDAPTAVDDTVTTDANTAITVADVNVAGPITVDLDPVNDVTTGDTDIDATDPTPTFLFADGTALGAIYTDITGGFTYDPTGTFDFLSQGQTNTDVIPYTIIDVNGGTSTGNVSVVVTGFNEAPVGVDDNLTTDQDTDLTAEPAATLTSNDTEVDNLDDTFLVSLATTSTLGTFSFNTAPNAFTSTGTEITDFTFTLNDDFDFLGLDGGGVTETVDVIFTQVIEDNFQESSTATLTLTIEGLNDLPVAGDDSTSVLKNDTVVLDYAGLIGGTFGGIDTDIDQSDTLSIINADGPLTLTSGAIVTYDTTLQQVTYDPNGVFNSLLAGDSAQDTFEYVLSDNNSGFTVGTVTVTIQGSQPAPVAVDDNLGVSESAALAFNDGSLLTNDTGVNLEIASVGTLSPNLGLLTSSGSPLDTFLFNTNGDFETLAQGATQQVTFTYVIQDDQPLSDTGTATITVTGQNDAPTAADDPNAGSVSEDGPFITITPSDLIDGTAGGLDSDIDIGDTLTVTSVSSIGATGIFTQTTLGGEVIQVQYDPNASFEALNVGDTALDTFIYTVQDDNGLAASATATVTINGVNDGPDAVDDVVATSVGTPVLITVLTNDTDVDNVVGDFTITSVSTPGAGNAVINAGTTITYTPNPGTTGTDTFTYVLEDGSGGSDTATVTVSVVGSAAAPVANDDSATTLEDTAVMITLSANDSDMDLDPFAPTVITGPSNGTVVLSVNTATPPGTVIATYTPNTDFNGIDSFVYRLDDDDGSDIAIVDITVTAVNDNPDANDDAVTVFGGSSTVIDILANDTDVDLDTLTPLILSGPSNGTAVVNLDGTVTYTPTIPGPGSDAFIYQITDGNGGLDTAVTVITINANNAPVAGDDVATTLEDTAVAIDVGVNDSDADTDPLTWTLLSGPSNGGVVVAGSTFTYTPNADFSGLDSFVYQVEDINGGTDMATVAVNVTPVNDAPVAVDDPQITMEDTPIVFDVGTNDSDPDMDTLNFTVLSGPNNGTLLQGGSIFSYTPALNFNGTDEIVYQVDDGNGLSATATAAITVTPVNDDPTPAVDTAMTTQNTAVTVDILANDSDPDGDTLTPAIISGPSNGAAVINLDNTLTYTPNPGFSGPEVITYQVTDGNGGMANATVTITVNDPPNLANDFAFTLEDNPVNVNVLGNDSDPEGGMLSNVAVATAPTDGTVSVELDGSITYTPNANFNGTDTFVYTAEDPLGAVGTATVSVIVISINDAPQADDLVVTIPEDTPVSLPVSLLISDPDGDATTTTIDVAPANGTAVVLGDGSIQYTPNMDFSGTDSVIYRATDPNSASDTGTLTINVVGANDDPDAVDDTTATAPATPVTINVLANDSDPEMNTLTVVAVSTPTGGTAVINLDNTITYTPNVGFFGADTFTYTITDGMGGMDTATVTVQVSETGTIWGIDNADGQLFNLSDPTAAAVSLTDYGTLYFEHPDTSQPINFGGDIHALAIRPTGYGYFGWNQDIPMHGVRGPYIFRIDLNSALVGGPNKAELVSNLPGFLPGSDEINGLSFDPNSGLLYALIETVGDDRLLQINPSDGAIVNDLGPISGVSDGEDIEFDAAGNLFVTDGATDSLYQLSPATGQIIATVDNMQQAGLTGNASNFEALAFDEQSGKYFTVDSATQDIVEQTQANGGNTALDDLAALGLTDVEALDTVPSYMANPIGANLSFGDVKPTTAFTEDGPAVLILPGAQISASGSDNFAHGWLEIAITGGTASSDDQLGVQNGNGFTLIGNALYLNGTQIASVWGGHGAVPLSIYFTSATITSDTVEQLLAQVSFDNDADDPGTTTREVSVTLNESNGAVSNAGEACVTVSVNNDAPEISFDGPSQPTGMFTPTPIRDQWNNPIVVDDVDGDPNPVMNLRLVALGGLMNLDFGALGLSGPEDLKDFLGLGPKRGDGVNDMVIHIQTTQDKLNQVLDNLTFTNTSGGHAFLRVEINDLGNGGGFRQVSTQMITMVK